MLYLLQVCGFQQRVDEITVKAYAKSITAIQTLFIAAIALKILTTMCMKATKEGLWAKLLINWLTR